MLSQLHLKHAHAGGIERAQLPDYRLHSGVAVLYVESSPILYP